MSVLVIGKQSDMRKRMDAMNLELEELYPENEKLRTDNYILREELHELQNQGS